MRYRIAVVAFVALTVGLTASHGGTAGARGSETVKLADNSFKPAKEKVRKGTKVRFKWTGQNAHNVTKRRGPGRSFNSQTTAARGVNFTKRFRRRGRYKLICTIHPTQMRLKLKVR